MIRPPQPSALTSVLALIAVWALFADALAFTVLIVPSHAAEVNPLVNSLRPDEALTLKSILALYLVGIGVFAPRSRFVRVALCLAIVAGTVGAVSTLGALG